MDEFQLIYGLLALVSINQALLWVRVIQLRRRRHSTNE